MSKKVAIVQSNYIPWKGYFDLINMVNMVDEFIIYDNVQYTKNDWRNRNIIKKTGGLLWLTIPVRTCGRFGQKICEAEISDQRWAQKHSKSIKTYYGKADHFLEIWPFLAELFRKASSMNRLSQINSIFIKSICDLLDITTKISFSMDFLSYSNQTEANEALITPLKQVEANEYFSGFSGKNYLDKRLFDKYGFKIKWMDYIGYKEYKQLHPPFEHRVSIIDMLLNLVGNFLKTLTYFYLQIILIYGMVMTMEVTHATQKPIPYNFEPR